MDYDRLNLGPEDQLRVLKDRCESVSRELARLALESEKAREVAKEPTREPNAEAEERLNRVRSALMEALSLTKMNANQGEPFNALAALVRKALKESA